MTPKFLTLSTLKMLTMTFKISGVVDTRPVLNCVHTLTPSKIYL